MEVGVAKSGTNKTNTEAVLYSSYPKSAFLTAKTEKEKHELWFYFSCGIISKIVNCTTSVNRQGVPPCV